MKYLGVSAKHVTRYGHWPEWRQFDRVAICERCIKPPSRGRLIPLPVLNRTASALR